MKYTIGVQLIGAERMEQIEKHGFNIANDADYNNEELLHAARYCLSPTVFDWPRFWNKSFKEKVDNKSYLQKLVVAGALIAAQIDRELYLENLKKQKELRHEASFVGKWVKYKNFPEGPIRINAFNEQGFILDYNATTGDGYIAHQQVHWYELANADEIKQHLEKQALIRGFKPGCSFETCAAKPKIYTANTKLEFHYDYRTDLMYIHSSEGRACCIYQEGVWGKAFSTADLRAKVLSYL
jgi:hypothetical protein